MPIFAALTTNSNLGCLDKIGLSDVFQIPTK